jgi:hypothetical protein
MSTCAAAMALALGAASGADAAGIGFPSSFRGGARVDVNAQGQAVVAWDGPTGVRVVVGDRAGGLSPATTLSPTTDTLSSPQVGIDERGDAIVVWETYRATGGGACSTCEAHLVSNGVWASVRHVGSGFGPPVALAGEQPDKGAYEQLADPQLAVGSTGHAVVAWSDASGAMTSIRAPGGELGTPQRVLPAGFVVRRAAITGDGEVLLADATGRVATRAADATFGAPAPLPDSTGTYGLPVLLTANTPGDALAAYYDDRGLVVSRRPAGGTWSAPARLTSVGGSGARAEALSDGGTGTVTFAQSSGDPLTGGRTSLLAATVSTGEPPVVEQVNAPGYDADASFDPAGVDMDGEGRSAVVFDRRDGLLGRGVVQLAIRSPSGSFQTVGALTSPEAGWHATGDDADVALGAAGELLATGVDHYPSEDRVMARWIGPAAADPAVVLDRVAARDTPLSAPTGHTAYLTEQGRRKLDRKGRILVGLTCVSFDRRPCAGTVKLTAGPRRWSAGRARFTIGPGATTRIRVRLSARAKSALKRHKTITLWATAVTTAPGALVGASSARIVVRR